MFDGNRGLKKLNLNPILVKCRTCHRDSHRWGIGFNLFNFLQGGNPLCKHVQTKLFGFNVLTLLDGLCSLATLKRSWPK